MGVARFTEYLKDYAPAAVRPFSYKDLRKTRIAVDSTLHLRRLFASPSDDETPKKHIVWTIRLLRLCRNLKCAPIAVFDGRGASVAKQKERAKRAKIRAEYQRRFGDTEAKRSRLRALDGIATALGQVNKPAVRLSILNQVKKRLDAAPIIEGSTRQAEAKRSILRLLEESKSLKAEVIIDEETLVEESAPKVEVLDNLVKVSITEQKVEPPPAPPAALPPFEEGPPPVESDLELTSISTKLTEGFTTFLTSSSAPSASELDILSRVLHPEPETRDVETVTATTVSVTSPTSDVITDLTDLRFETYEALTVLKRRTAMPTFRQYDETKEAFRILGVPVISSPDGYEAEAVCAALVKEGKAEYVSSEDTDVVIFGGKLLRWFSAAPTMTDFFFRASKKLQVFDPVEIRKELGDISTDRLIDLAILLGTDFAPTIEKLGRKGIREVFTDSKRIEDLVRELPHIRLKTTGKPKYAIPEGYLEEVEVAREVFRVLPDVTSEKSIEIDSWLKTSEEEWNQKEDKIMEMFNIEEFHISGREERPSISHTRLEAELRGMNISDKSNGDDGLSGGKNDTEIKDPFGMALLGDRLL
ncbi:hypothetical protein YB2330_005209 [Saitoella coloradoensis]